MQIFLKLGLVEVLDSGTFYMSNIELLIGQSSTEAERKRVARLQNKALSTPRTNGGHLSDIRPPEIEIKREIEKGRPARAYGRYQNVFLTDEELADLQASFPTVWGQYIEKLFPALGVRFIAINDNYDTAHLDSSSSLMLPFKNLMLKSE